MLYLLFAYGQPFAAGQALAALDRHAQTHWSIAERQRLARITHPTRRAQFLIGHQLPRWLLRSGMPRYTRAGALHWVACGRHGACKKWSDNAYSSGGMPCGECRCDERSFDERDIDSTSLWISLSHAGNWVGCALSDTPVGFDLECCGPPDLPAAHAGGSVRAQAGAWVGAGVSMDVVACTPMRSTGRLGRLLSRVCSAEETAWVQPLAHEGSGAPQARFLELWTLKEAWFKYHQSPLHPHAARQIAWRWAQQGEANALGFQLSAAAFDGLAHATMTIRSSPARSGSGKGGVACLQAPRSATQMSVENVQCTLISTQLAKLQLGGVPGTDLLSVQTERLQNSPQPGLPLTVSGIHAMCWREVVLTGR